MNPLGTKGRTKSGMPVRRSRIFHNATDTCDTEAEINTFKDANSGIRCKLGAALPRTLFH